MTRTAGQPVTDASVWTGAGIAEDPSWRIEIGEAERDALVQGLKAVQRKGLSMSTMLAEDFPIGPPLQALLDRIAVDTRDGRGFVLLKGFPVETFSIDEIRLMYYGMFLNAGTCISQDGRASLVADVIERGQIKTPLTRAYGSKREAPLHVDLADVVALLCVRQAKQGAATMLASSPAVYNAVLREHPEWLPALARGFHWDRFGEHAEWESAISDTPIPLLSEANGQVSCRYNRNWINGAFARTGKQPTATETAMFDFIDRVAYDNRLEFLLEPGDLYVASNFTVLHGKVAHEDFTTDDRLKRHLMRIWYTVPGFRSLIDEPSLRYGVMSHGNIGWTGPELIARKHLKPGNRRLHDARSAAA